MKSFHTMPLYLLLLVSANLCRFYGNPKYRQNRGIDARNALASENRFTRRFQKRADNDNPRDPVEKSEVQIRKYQAQIDKLQVKIADEKEKLKKLKNSKLRGSNEVKNATSILLENKDAHPVIDRNKGTVLLDPTGTPATKPNKNKVMFQENKIASNAGQKTPVKTSPVDLPEV